MAVTKRHVFMLFVRGWSISKLCLEYRLQVDWVESALRKYYPKAHK